MAENEQSHRHQSEKMEQTNRMRVTLVGQIFAFLIGISGISGGIFLVKYDKSISGFGVFFSSLASIMGVFFYGRRPKVQKQIRPPVSSNI
jgi:uncharacterized membrane protein